MSKPHSQVVSIHVDATNPGQFFACCGLIELAERLWGKGLLGWFAEQRFFVERQDRKTCPQNISEGKVSASTGGH